MKQSTIDTLNGINQAFYQITADQFDLLRRNAWPGWTRLLPHLAAMSPTLDHPLHVLDVGCGNGRFGYFLAHKFSPDIVYHGQDNNPVLLDHAGIMLQGINARLETRDIIQSPPDVTDTTVGSYDLIGMFGVIHHVPGAAQRLDLMRRLAAHLSPGGLFAFACWRFYEYERYRERLVEWPEGVEREEHDYLLDWRRGDNALRYCHYVDDQEHAALVAATNLTEIDTYRADGDNRDVNRYSVLRKEHH